MAALTLAAMSGEMAAIPCAVLACSAPLAITSATSLPSMTALQPGIRSPHLSIFAMGSSLVKRRGVNCVGPATRLRPPAVLRQSAARASGEGGDDQVRGLAA